MRSDNTIAGGVFVLVLLATFLAALLARRHSAGREPNELANESLNKWLVGLSAGTTANSGFIVTAAVGLGYSYGLQWIMLPLAWLVGDLVFWYFFPARINAFGRASHATTISELLEHGIAGPVAAAVSVMSALIILCCLAGYTSAQWLAGQKFLAGAFGLPDVAALAAFALLIVAYSGIGGFRGSVYTDTLQAAIRIVGTLLAIASVIWIATDHRASFAQNIEHAGPAFLELFPGGTALSISGFVIGFAAAAIGFGLGQPQIVSRYLAGSSPEETRSAWWIYMGFVQFTWVSMTVFGVLLRGITPSIADPEVGLSLFFRDNIGSFATGVIAADVFATIAATSNGILIAMAQAINHDLLPRLNARLSDVSITATTLFVGVCTMIFSLILHGSIVSVALSSVSMLGAGLAAPVMIKIMRWRHTAMSIIASIVCGLAAALAWKTFGLGASVNEAAIGIIVGLFANFVAAFQSYKAKAAT